MLSDVRYHLWAHEKTLYQTHKRMYLWLIELVNQNHSILGEAYSSLTSLTCCCLCFSLNYLWVERMRWILNKLLVSINFDCYHDWFSLDWHYNPSCSSSLGALSQWGVTKCQLFIIARSRVASLVAYAATYRPANEYFSHIRSWRSQTWTSCKFNSSTPWWTLY